MRVWVIDAGLPGVTNQCIGIAKAIHSQVSCEISVVHTRIRTKLFRKPVLWALRRSLMGAGSRNVLSSVLARMFYSGMPRKRERPDIVITALGRSEYVAALLGGPQGAFAIHIGAPIYLSASAFNLLVLVNAENATTGTTPKVNLSIYPTQILRHEMEGSPVKGKATQSSNGQSRWAILIGGDGAGYTYTPHDWNDLALGLGKLANHFDARLLVTTSRRTGVPAERQISGSLLPEIVDEAVYYGTRPQSVMLKFLGACNVIFCTADSRSMIADAINTGRPVYAVSVPGAKPDTIHQRFLDVHEAARRIRRVDISELDAIDVDADCHHWFRPLENCWSSDFLAALHQTNIYRSAPEAKQETG